jgi:hypothetical protein
LFQASGFVVQILDRHFLLAFYDSEVEREEYAIARYDNVSEFVDVAPSENVFNAETLFFSDNAERATTNVERATTNAERATTNVERTTTNNVVNAFRVEYVANEENYLYRKVVFDAMPLQAPIGLETGGSYKWIAKKVLFFVSRNFFLFVFSFTVTLSPSFSNRRFLFIFFLFAERFLLNKTSLSANNYCSLNIKFSSFSSGTCVAD